MSEQKNTTDEDLKLLYDLLVEQPHGISALRRLDAQITSLALVLNAHVLLQNDSTLNPTQAKVMQQVVKVTSAPAVQMARQISERVRRESMKEAGLDPDSPKDRVKFALSVGSNIKVSLS